MVIFQKTRLLLIAALFFATSLLSSCRDANEAAASQSPSPEAAVSPSSAQETAASPSRPLDRSYSGIVHMLETRDPEEYDSLINADDYLHVEDGTLNIWAWRIESFDFLSGFDNTRHLIISECYIPEGVTIPRLDALNGVTKIQIHDIYGSGAADVLSDCLPLPKLDVLDISGEVPNKSPLPAVPSLTDLYVSVPDTLNVISNNTHITGALSFGVPGMTMVYEDIVKLDGVEKFSSIQYLRLPHTVLDISPLAGCDKLRILDAYYSERIDSLKPLYELEHLEEIIIRGETYNALPGDERAYFTPQNNSDADAVHVYTDAYEETGEDEYLNLEGQTIQSFDFLRDYPNLKHLTIIDCDIADGLVLPPIKTLTRLTVYDPDVLDIIKNNTQLAGYLNIGTGYSLLDLEARKSLKPFENLAGLEAFHSLEELNVGDPVTDISALSGCVNLRGLYLSACTSIETLKPLYGLRRLRMLVVPPTAFESLPQEDRERFSDKHKPYMTDLEWR